MSRHRFATRIAEAPGLNKPDRKGGNERHEAVEGGEAERQQPRQAKARNTLKTRFHDTSLAVKIFSEEWGKTRGDNTQKHGQGTKH